ncbi:hypothetical protein [Roseofilum casamattae]|uniref:Uncharacterized protein n=1 Tax=Roseofilum casamattae BLCC-M143 TaxID=3022442 RepID=A0ABT7C130_9CYAN|nr:hypothetical protein [Roseofilum casamattae]MDJ1185158.1 hypothetical protein [Roseofilum casamattae BLCC-M143]
MTIQIDLSQQLERELSIEAEQINLSLSEYILHIISLRQVGDNAPQTGAELISYWQNEGLINSRPEIEDSQEFARQIRYQAERRQQL